MPSSLFLDGGEAVRLQERVGAGGQGVVYRIAGNRVLKLYHTPPQAAQVRKLETLRQMTHLASFAALPLQLAYADAHLTQVVGFTMAHIRNHHEVHLLTSTRDRKQYFPRTNHWQFLLTVAKNLATLVHNLHETGLVVGDVNERAFLVAQNGTVKVIDCDSFQVAGVPCPVGTPLFTPPELQGAHFAHTPRTPHHDAFGVSVLIFQLLMLGVHPFSGHHLHAAADQSIEANITRRAAYGSALLRLPAVAPPPHLLPPALLGLFRRAFSDPEPTARPTCLEWVQALDAQLGALVRCPANTAHLYPVASPACPWCAVEARIPGFSPFGYAPVASQVGTAQLRRALRAIPRPPALHVPTHATPQPPSPQLAAWAGQIGHLKARLARARNHLRLAATLGLAVAGLGALAVGTPLAALVGLALGGGWVGLLALRLSLARRQLAQAQAPLRTQHQAAQAAWAQLLHEAEAYNANTDFDAQLKRIHRLLRQAKHLPTPQEMAQRLEMETYLSPFRIAHAHLKNIGPERLASLKSYGYETAYDVYARKVRVPGIGPVLAQSLHDWATQLAQRKPATPTTEAHAARAEAELARLRAQAAQQVVAETHKLKQLADLRQAQHAHLAERIRQAYPALQALEQLAR
jgi:DNA-binding helix-hairpin-helix protein with protein kinase domain